MLLSLVNRVLCPLDLKIVHRSDLVTLHQGIHDLNRSSADIANLSDEKEIKVFRIFCSEDDIIRKIHFSNVLVRHYANNAEKLAASLKTY